MNDHDLDVFVGIIQTIFLLMVVGPACYFIWYWDKEHRGQVTAPVVRHYFLYKAYMVIAILLLLTTPTANSSIYFSLATR
jgi:hypothetical protein